MTIAVNIISIWVFIYSVSYGNWTLKAKNKPGAVAIYTLATIQLLLASYRTFFTQ